MENKKEITNLNDIDLNDTVGGDDFEFVKKDSFFYTYKGVNYELEKVNKIHCRLFLCDMALRFVQILKPELSFLNNNLTICLYDDNLTPEENLKKYIHYLEINAPHLLENSYYVWYKIQDFEVQDIKDIKRKLKNLKRRKKIRNGYDFEYGIFQDDYYFFAKDYKGNITTTKNGVEIQI
jgi:hypothetical protein